MKKLGVILAVLLAVGMLAVLSTAVYASSSIEGFAEILQAGMDGLEAYFDFLIEIFELVL